MIFYDQGEELMLSHATKDTAGVYKCHLESRYSQVATRKFTVSIMGE